MLIEKQTKSEEDEREARDPGVDRGAVRNSDEESGGRPMTPASEGR